MSVRRADLTEGTRIRVSDRFGDRTGTVDYLCKDFDGRSWRTMVMFTPDDPTGRAIDGAWLSDVTTVTLRSDNNAGKVAP